MRYRSIRVFSLGGWSPLIPTGFHVSRSTLDTGLPLHLSLTGLLPSMAELSSSIQLGYLDHYTGPNPIEVTLNGLGSSPFARRYLGNLN